MGNLRTGKVSGYQKTVRESFPSEKKMARHQTSAKYSFCLQKLCQLTKGWKVSFSTWRNSEVKLFVNNQQNQSIAAHEPVKTNNTMAKIISTFKGMWIANHIRILINISLKILNACSKALKFMQIKPTILKMRPKYKSKVTLLWVTVDF